MIQPLVSLVAGLFSAETWKIIEVGSKFSGILLGVMTATLAAINFLAGQSATFLEKQPREVPTPLTAKTSPATAAPSKAPTMPPLNLLIVAHSSPEAQAFARKIAEQAPAGSQVGHLDIAHANISTPKNGVLVCANHNDASATKNWLYAIGIPSEDTGNPMVPLSMLMRSRDSVVIIVGPK